MDDVNPKEKNVKPKHRAIATLMAVAMALIILASVSSAGLQTDPSLMSIDLLITDDVLPDRINYGQPITGYSLYSLATSSDIYSLGETVVIAINAPVGTEFDMLLSDGRAEAIYRFSGEQYPVEYTYPAAKIGEHSIRIAFKSPSGSISRTARFNVVRSLDDLDSAMLENLLFEPKVASNIEKVSESLKSASQQYTFENTSSTIEVVSPDGSMPHASSEGLLLNFTLTGQTADNASLGNITSNYTLDNNAPSTIDPYIMISDPNTSNITYLARFTKQLDGNLPFGIVSNGAHTIKVSVKDTYGYVLAIEHNFTVNDTNAPIFVAMNFANNSLLNLSSNTFNFSWSMSEAANVSYAVYSNYKMPSEAIIGVGKIELLRGNFSLNLSLANGSNMILLNVTDMHGNLGLQTFAVNYTSNYTIESGNCSNGILDFHHGQNETGIDCGGPCALCVPLSITTDKNVYNQTEQVEITVNAKQNSNVTITVTGGSSSYSAVSKVFPTYYIYTDTANIGTYTISAEMNYMGIISTSSRTFQVVSNQPSNPLTVSISSNRSSINEGEVILFNAVVAGNSSKVDFKWDMNEDGIVDSRDEKFAYTYTLNGTFSVNLTINSSPWNQSAFKSIAIKKTYNATVKVTDNRTGTAIDQASVNLDDTNLLTDSSGFAYFTVQSGSHSLTASKAGYLPATMSINLAQSSQFDMPLQKIDTLAPTIDLVAPENETIFTTDSATFEFDAQDDSRFNCSLYTSILGDWWALGAATSSEPGSHRLSVQVSGLDDNATHLWRVQCRDEKGNSNFSSIRQIIVNTSRQTNVLSVNTELQSVQANAFIARVDQAMADLEKFGRQEKEVAEVIRFKRSLELSKTEMQRHVRDLFDLKWRRLNQTELESETQRILDAMSELSLNAPKSLRVLETAEFVKYPARQDIESLLLVVLKLDDTKKNKDSIKSLLDEMEKLQSKVTVTTKTAIYDIEKMSGEHERFTLIFKKVKFTGEADGAEYYEVIPKTIAKKTSDINFLFEKEVVKEDPIIKRQAAEDMQIAYILNQELDLKLAQDIKSIVLPTKIDKSKVAQSRITGLAFVDIFRNRIFKANDARLIIEISIILILGLVYVAYSMDDLKQIRIVRTILVGKKMAHIGQVVDSMRALIEARNYADAKAAYGQVCVLYKELNPKEKKEMFNVIIEMHNRLDVLYINSLLNSVGEKLKQGRLSEAASDYATITELYSGISKEFKAEVLKRCTDLHTRIEQEQAKTSQPAK